MAHHKKFLLLESTPNHQDSIMHTFAMESNSQIASRALLIIFIALLLAVGVYYLLSVINGHSEQDDLVAAENDKKSINIAMLVTGIVSLLGVTVSGAVLFWGRRNDKFVVKSGIDIFSSPPSNSVVLCDLDPQDRFEECKVFEMESPLDHRDRILKSHKAGKVVVQCCTDTTRKTTIYTLISKPTDKKEAFVQDWVREVSLEHCLATECSQEFYEERRARNEARANIMTPPKCTVKKLFDAEEQKAHVSLVILWTRYENNQGKFEDVREHIQTYIDCGAEPINDKLLQNFIYSWPPLKLGKLTNTDARDYRVAIGK